MNTISGQRHYWESLAIGVVLTAVSYMLGYWLHWIDSLNWLEIFAVFTSYVCTWLCVRERRINYPIGAISSVAYAVLFFQGGLLASATLNVYLVLQLIYGWFRWRSDSNARPVTLVRPLHWVYYLLATGVFYSGAAVIWHLTHVAVVWTDIAIMVLTILAQWLLDNKKLENWIVWFVVDVLAIYTYGSIGLHLVQFQYVLFLINTLVGFYVWRGTKNAQGLRADDGHAADHGSSAAHPVR